MYLVVKSAVVCCIANKVCCVLKCAVLQIKPAVC